MTKTIQPASDQVFARVIKQETVSKSGIIIAAEDKGAKTNTATVINVGSKVSWLNPDDTIVYKIYSTTDIKLEGEDYILIANEDILGKVVGV